MKQNLQISRKIALALVLLVTVTVVNAQTTAIATGNWNNAATWSAGIPDAADAVTINNGVTVTVNTAAECASIDINSGNTNSGITISGSNSLTVSGAITVNAPTSNNRNRTISVGSGTLSCASVSFANTTDNSRDINLTIGTGTVSVSGNFVMSGSASENAVSFTDAGMLNLGGTFTGGTVTVSTGTIRYTGTGSQTIRNMDYNNLSFTGSGTKTLPGDIIVTGDVLVEAGSVLTLGGSDIDIDFNGNRSLTINGTVNINGNGRLIESSGGTKTLIIGSTGILNITDNGGAGLPALNAFSLDPVSTVNFGSTDNQTIENSATYGNLTTSGSGTKTLETSGGTMNFAGTITIGNGTTLNSNSKTMNVGGDFINNGSFTRGTSTVVLDGSVEQELGGTTSTVFTSLTINNASTTGVTLSNDCSVASNLTLTDGVVNTDDSPGLLTIDAGASVSGGSLAAHINGPLAKTGDTDFTFPVGDGARYRPITMSSLTSATGTSLVTARYVLGNPRTAYGVAGTGPALTMKDISLCEYWDLNDGAESISAVIGLQYSSTSPCNTNGYITDAATLVVAHHNGSTWENLGAAPGATLTNMTAGMTSTFSPFTIGTTNAILNPLPVSFTDVKAFEKGTGVQIDWTNATESDMSAYIIERSANGIDFTAIGQATPRSNQFDRVSYSYTDATPLAGTNFYRIKAIEMSGKNVYTKSLRVDIGRSPKGISLYPNPVRGSEVNIGFTALKGQYSLLVLNTAGQMVYRQQLNHAGGTVAQSVSLPASLKAGVYNVLITGDNYKETKMFVVQ